MSVPAVAAPTAWHAAGAIDGAALTGLACPSATLCVAVDAAGHALTSSSPTAVTSWHAVDADRQNALSGLSCPSTSLCVAVDGAGNVVTSSDPTGNVPAWTAANITAGQALTGVSCASTTTCAAIGNSVLVSSDPGGGSGAWSDTGVGRGTYYESLHYGGPPDDAPPTGIACVEAPLICVVVNDAGGAFVSQDPTGGASTWAVAGPSSAEDFGVSCIAGGLCVATCPVGVAAGPGNCPGSDYEAGSIVAWHPLDEANPATGGEVAPDNLTQLWCESSSLCFATDGTAAPGLFSTSGPGQGKLYVSTNPAGPSSSWSPAYTDHAGITAVACPSIACIAVDRAGNLLVGLRPGTAAQIRRALLRQLVPQAARIRRLLRDGGYSFSFDAPAPGRLAISWQAGLPGKATDLGRLSKTFSKAGTRKLTIKLTRQGKRALEGAQHLRVSETMSLTPRGNLSVAAHTAFTIRR